MDLAFNEISFRPYFENEHKLADAFIELIKTFKHIQKQYDFKHLIFPTDISITEVLPGINLETWLTGVSGITKHQIVNIIRRKPFSNEVLEDTDDNIDSYSFQNDEIQIEETYCIGLGLAHIIQSATLSLNTHPFWQNDEIEIIKTNANDLSTDNVIVFNSSSCENLTESFIAFVETNTEIVLQTTNINPENKNIHFRDDHGIDVLKAFAQKLVMSSYVVSVINSTPFNSYTSRFIQRIHADGRIELILHWEDSGYGMVIQTTGTNYRETEAIAEILSEKFDH